MAEFQKVIEQFKRLCDSANQDCSSCGLRNMSCSIKDIVDNSVEYEKRVMQWAVEHPEPVYPTWEEWLQSVGVMESSEGLLRRIQGQLLIDGIPAHAVPTSKVLQPMDADIAEKLGIEPKEG